VAVEKPALSKELTFPEGIENVPWGMKIPLRRATPGHFSGNRPLRRPGAWGCGHSQCVPLRKSACRESPKPWL